MSDTRKTKKQLIEELEELRKRVKTLEARQGDSRPAESPNGVVKEQATRLLDSVSELIVFHDKEMNVAWANQTAAESLNKKVADLIGRKCYDLWHQRDIPCDGCPVATALKTGQSGQYETSSPDGRIWQISGYPLFDEAGSIIGAAEMTLDITRFKEAEREIRESEEMFRELAESSPNMIFINAGGRIAYVNQKCIEIMGYSRDEFYSPDFDFLDLISDNFKQSVAENFRSIMQGVRVEPHEMILVTKTGGEFEAIVSTEVIRYAGDYAVLGVVTDISGIREAEEALRISEERYRALISDAGDAIFLADMEGNLVEANTSAEELLGYSMEELQSMHFSQLHPPEELERTAKAFQEISHGAGSLSDGLALAKDGRRIPVDINGRAIEYGGRIILQGIFHDISDRKRVEEALRLSEERYRGLFEDSPVPIWLEDFSSVKDAIDRIDITGQEGIRDYLRKHPEIVFDASDRIEVIDVNEASVKMLGAKNKDDLKANLGKVFGPESLDAFIEGFIAAKEDRTVFEKETVLLDLQGNRKEVLLRWALAPGHEKALDKVYVSFTDITDLMKAEKALRESEQRYKLLFNVAQDMAFVHPIDNNGRLGNFIEVNDVACKLLGYSREELLEKGPFDIGTVPQAGYMRKAIDRFLQHRQATLEADIITRDGGRIPVEINSLMFDFQGQQAVLSLARDVTDRKKAETALRQENSFRTAIIKSAAEGLAVCHEISEFPYVRFTIWNDRMTEITGYTMEEINLAGWYQSVYPDPAVRDKAAQRMSRMREGDDILAEEWEIVRKDKQKRIITISTSIVEAGDGRVHVLALMHDVTERRKAEHALAEEKERLAVTLRSIGDGVITTDTDGKVAMMNKVAEALTGWTQQQAAGRPIAEIFEIVDENTSDPRENPVETVLRTEGAVEIADRTMLIARSGEHRLIADTASPIKDEHSKVIGVVLVFRDITEKRNMERELARAEKLESLGILAGGIAHDFNNILTGILANVSMARHFDDKREARVKRLEEAENACMRARDLTQQLLTFSRGGEPVRSASSLRDLIKGSAEFVLRGSNSICKPRLPEDLWPAMVDSGQIGQVLQNLIINADQAMPGGGEITVRAENLMAGSPGDSTGMHLKPGPYVWIVVSDHGTGIPEEHIEKIFDPFFTTKQKGSGLGLSISYSIVRNHDGYISVESRLGEGTTFHILIPALPGEAVSEEAQAREPVTGKGKLLVMDDEHSIIELLQIMLRELGYEAQFAANGELAVEMFKNASDDGRPYDAVILDLTIPGGMGGKETLGKLRELDPQVKAIVSSGYSTDPIMADYRQHGFEGVIAKPYNTESLSRVIHEVLGAK